MHHSTTRQSSVLQLFWEGHSYRQIAASLGITEDTARMRMYRFRRKNYIVPPKRGRRETVIRGSIYA